jgi:histidyl-tRNA synthetase
VEKINNEKLFGENLKAKQALEEMSKLGQNLRVLGCYDSIVLDLSLARGLDYYTGVIYEAVLTDETGIGSIASGGRYD